MTFAWPWLLAGAGAVCVLAAVLHAVNTRSAKRKLAGIAAPRLRGAMLSSVSWGRRWLRALVFASALGLLWVALARPQHGMELVETERPSVDFLIALDVSRSMLAEDMDGRPRLDAAKEGIGRLLDEARGSRVGVIAFAGEAFLAAPITTDHEAVKRQVEPLSSRSLARQGSDMAQAAGLAVETFAKSDYETKALVFVTDGEELQGQALVAAHKAARAGVTVFTIGVGGTGGARIPQPDRRRSDAPEFARNEFNRDVVTRLNAPMLRQVAAAGGGFYQALGPKGGGLITLWEQGLRPLAKTMQPSSQKTPREYFQWPLAAALILLLVEMLIRDRRPQPFPSAAAT